MGETVFPRARWRLLWQPEPLPGPWNMAVDEALLQGVMDGTSPPTLRLYAWAPPALSLGVHQAFADVDPARLAARGWDVVRRLTGGRAILHTDELTYAVVAPPDDPRVQGDVLAAYQRLSRALLWALRHLGVPATWETQRDAYRTQGQHHPVCFQVPAVYEITVQGRKLVGSAQARKLRGVLQHGTLPLTGDITRIVDALAFADETARAQARAKLAARATTLHALLGRPVPWEEAARAVAEGFRQTLNLELVPARLTPQERRRAQTLWETKYATRAWTRRH